MTSSIEKVLQAANKSIEDNMKAIESGGNINVSVFDGHVREFCSALNELSTDDAKKYEPALLDLMSQVTKIKEMLEEKRKSLTSEMGSLDKRSAANDAYGKTLVLTTQADDS